MFRTFAMLLLFTSATQAADSAQSRAIGFSPDGKYFAFEQYGIQDGSGFPYSEIYILDIAKDEWATTPFKAVSESEDAKLSDARKLTAAQAFPVINKLNVTAAYDTIAHIPFTHIVGDRRKTRFARYYNSMGDVSAYDSTGSYEIEVRDVKVAQNLNCLDADIITLVGMELTLKNLKTGVTKNLAKDDALPKSRSCPIGYDIEAIYAPADFQVGNDPLVALIGVYSRGFEGSDRRMIAVPFELFE